MVSSTNINDEADERAYSRVAVYGSETERSTSSGESTLSSTPLSVSPMPFEFITKDAGGWSNDLARFNDGFQVRAQKSIPETGQEDEVRFSEKDHFLSKPPRYLVMQL